jgi:hypothetical protein
MNASKIRTFSSWLLVVLTLSTGSSGSAIAFDPTPPKVESCTISPRLVSDVSGGNVRVTIKVVSKNGLSSNVLSVLNLKNNTSSATRQLGGFIMTRESGDEFSGTWIQDIAVKPGLMPGIYELSIFPLTDKLQNGTFFLGCPGQEVLYGSPTLIATPTPTPTRTPTSTPSPTKDTQSSISQESYNAIIESNTQLKNQLAILQAQLKSLIAVQNKYKKICSVKIKPKGC